MKSIIAFPILFLPGLILAQSFVVDSSLHRLPSANQDSALYDIYKKYTTYYLEKDRDSAVYFADKCISISKKNNKLLELASSLSDKGHALFHQEKFIPSFHCFIEAVDLAEKEENEDKSWRTSNAFFASNQRLTVLAGINQDFGSLMLAVGNQDAGIEKYETALRLASEIKDSVRMADILVDIAAILIDKGKWRDSKSLLEKAIEIFKTYGIPEPAGYANTLLGNINAKQNNDSAALSHSHKALAVSIPLQNYTNIKGTYRSLTNFYMARGGSNDSALYYARKYHSLSLNTDAMDISGSSSYLYKVFQRMGNKDSAYWYQGLAMEAKDSIFQKRIKTLNELNKLSLEQTEKLIALDKENTARSNRLKIYALGAVLIFVSVFSFYLFKRNQHKQKANAILHEQKIKVEKTLSDLKSTQSQLIQSEKMASLGELTAGIAHEIQNPLNFVNNFAEVNTELIDEIKQAVQSGNITEILALAENVKQNLDKINFHGKRADGIVKSMLQHSRSNEQSGKNIKEPTDINAIADEYLRLAYHGFRARDKGFNATLKTEFDESLSAEGAAKAGLGLIEVVGQDIARAILNLITNAFYTVHEKSKGKEPPEASGRESYTPTVSVSTKRLTNIIEIRVQDNGSGIPQHVLDKIFQPFFTTKPTGQGTGLGLSLCYDIVKAHGGELRVDTEVGKGSEFIIELPVV